MDTRTGREKATERGEGREGEGEGEGHKLRDEKRCSYSPSYYIYSQCLYKSLLKGMKKRVNFKIY